MKTYKTYFYNLIFIIYISTPKDTNLIPNSSFEEGLGEAPEGWTTRSKKIK